MGQFKPMVKMETTEPSVILKLKKGGHVAMKSKGENGHAPMKKMDGGAMAAMAGTPALIGRPALNAPVRAPKRPSMAARRAAMMAAQRPRMAAPADMPMMKKGGKAEAGEVETPAMHKMEMKGIKGIGKQLKSHEGKPASKAHAGLKKGGMATGGVRMGNAGGFKTNGVVLGAGGYKKGGMPMKDGKPEFLKKMMGGGMNTGGVANSNAGGFKKGGAAKKFADGGLIDTGRAVSMPQGHKKPSQPISTIRFAGTFKKGGKVKKFNGGGDAQSDKETKGYKDTYATQKAENLADLEAMNPMTYIRPLVRPLVSKVKGLFGSSDAPGAITKTKESTTIVPKKRSGGMSNC
jgi:hypothetical protein